jgi:hypothetical protein
MFAQERMSRQKFAFGASIMPIMEYQKGGGGGGSPAAPPPPDYTPQWNQVQKNRTEVLNGAGEVGALSNTFQNTIDPAQKVALAKQLDDKVDALIKESRDTLALNATIPDSWFGERAGERSIAVSNFNAVVNNLEMYRISIPPDGFDPTGLGAAQATVAAQMAALKAIGRTFGAPQDPNAVMLLYPVGSWQYTLWQQGYSLAEIAWAENDNATNLLLNKYGNNMYLFLNMIRIDLDNAILNKQIPAGSPINNGPVALPNSTPVIHGIDTWIGSVPARYVPSGPIVGIGKQTGLSVGRAAPVGFTDSDGNPLTVGGIEYYYGGDGNTYRHSSDTFSDWLRYEVPFGVQLCKTPWTYVPAKSSEIPAPVPAPPVNSPIDLGVWSRRYRRKYGNQPYMPNPSLETPRYPQIDLPYIDPGYDTVIAQVSDNGQTGWNITGSCGTPLSVTNGTDTHFTGALVGAGHSVSTIDTVRRTLRRTRFKPNANVIDIAMAMAEQIAAGSIGQPAIGLGNPLTAITGVAAVDIHEAAVLRQSQLTQRQARRARRGLYGGGGAFMGDQTVGSFPPGYLGPEINN